MTEGRLFGMSSIILALAVVVRGDEISWEQAQCIVSGKKIAFFGDSITRYCYYNLNYWLEVGEVPDEEYTGDHWGDNDEDYDTAETWDTRGILSGRQTHRQYITKSFEDYDDAYTEFYFIQDVWYSDMEAIAGNVEDFDYVVFNTGWWALKDEADPAECGLDWSNDCADGYEDKLEDVVNNLFDPVIQNGGEILWRGTTCCGEGDDDEWVPSIEDQNDAAEDFFKSNDHVTFVDVFNLWDYDDIDDATFDGNHPVRDNCLKINLMLLAAMDKDGACTTTTTTTYAPTYSPTTSSCTNSNSWYKKNDPSKNCDWVASIGDKRRCGVKGEDDQFGYEACHLACDTCPGTCQGEDSTSWYRSGDSSRDCEWASDAYPNRCTKTDDAGIYGFEACPHACRTCTYCDDSDAWALINQPSKGCDWVEDAHQNRCTKYGQYNEEGDWAFAFAACPDACRVCPNYGDCSDDSGWVKNNEDDDSKNCDWVADLPDSRCGVTGTDSSGDTNSDAYQACRVACSTC